MKNIATLSFAALLGFGLVSTAQAQEYGGIPSSYGAQNQEAPVLTGRSAAKSGQIFSIFSTRDEATGLVSVRPGR